jgi:transglutaminase-like putative cysteine protease
VAPYRPGIIMNISVKILLAAIIPFSAACSERHLINDRTYLNLIENSFLERKELAVNRAEALFTVFSQPLSERQREALKFLYAFMPLNDLADYNGDFFLANVNVSLRALDETPWGKDIPEEIFLHYVLPCRVNNENLDSFRIYYYDEIINRVKDKNLLDAALEINHWCHEKVSYQPADRRTSAPLSTVLSARGRCGEESTFTVAALRSVGIPARQVYTPRWAHTDDNHAWVEVWFNDKWYYMGACEPEPVIDRGWFTEAARRAMLVHTKSFGASLKDENSINRYKNFTEVNNLSKYAVTKRIFVKVTDRNNIPVQNAKVEYQLYNYAEFYPIAVVPADENGISRFETGLGDLLIWASDKDKFNYKMISVGETDTLKLVLSRTPGDTYSIDLDLDVPVVRAPLPGPSADIIENNLTRIKNENNIRQKYIESWMKPDEAKLLASDRNIDTSRVLNILARSMGNYKEIRSFLSVTPDSLIIRALSMLEILPDKDLRDTKESILSDHLLNTFKTGTLTNVKDKIFLEFVLSPRVANEIISPWRGYFRKMLPSGILQNAHADPLLVAQYLEKNIRIDDDENYYKTPLTPIGVNELKVSDTFSRAICFVAICRSIGIPSRLEPGSNVPQYFLDSEWNDLFFSDQKQPTGEKGYIKLFSDETKPVPEYHIHFTLAKYQNGHYNTLEYADNSKVSDFIEELSLSPGSYVLVTGNRLSSSKILSSINFFDLSEGEHKTVQIKIRKDMKGDKILGNIDLNSIISLLDRTKVSLERIKEKGVVLLWIEPDKEPTKHIFNDLPRLKEELDDWGGYFLFFTDPSTNWKGFNNEELNTMPANTLCGCDEKILQRSFRFIDSSEIKLPYVVMADKNGNILYFSAGYRIGIGEQILRFTR